MVPGDLFHFFEFSLFERIRAIMFELIVVYQLGWRNTGQHLINHQVIAENCRSCSDLS